MGLEGGLFASPPVNALDLQVSLESTSNHTNSNATTKTTNSSGWGPKLTTNGVQVEISGVSMPLLNSSILSFYAAASSDSCSSNGQGRVIIPSKKNQNEDADLYTVSACDVLQGHFVLMYYPAENRVLLYSQTFGPMSYTAALLVRVNTYIFCYVCIFFIILMKCDYQHRVLFYVFIMHPIQLV